MLPRVTFSVAPNHMGTLLEKFISLSGVDCTLGQTWTKEVWPTRDAVSTYLSITVQPEMQKYTVWSLVGVATHAETLTVPRALLDTDVVFNDCAV